MTLTDLTTEELTVYNQLDKAVGKLLKDRSRYSEQLGNFDAKTAAKLRDGIATTTSAWMREQFIKDARKALATDEWYNASSVVGGGD